MTYTETTTVVDEAGQEIARSEREQATLLELKESDPAGYDRALETVALMALDYEWWLDTLDGTTEHIQEKYGITYDPKECSFDLDRGSMFLFGAASVDARVLLKRAGVDLRSKDAREILEHGLVMGVNYGGFGDRGWIGFRAYEGLPDYLGDDICDAIRDTLRDAQNEMLKILRDEQEYLTSAEHLEEWADINEWRFYENGALA